MKAGIALAMIVRNDAERLDRCLQSVKGIVDAIHVVDTGSTDGTQDVAASHGASVIERSWPDDFSIAVNWALDLVQHDWTLRLDSDEWLLPGSDRIIRETTARSDVYAATAIREDYHADGRFAETLVMRLWRTHPAMRVQGIIHEHFPPESVEAAAQGRQVAATGLRIGHDGYLGGNQAEKHRRNLHLVELELAQRPGNPLYKSERVRLQYHLNDPGADASADELIDSLLQVSHLDEAPTLMAASPVALRLDRVSEAELHSARITDVLRLARGWFHREPAATYAAAKTFIRRKDLRAALDALLDLEDMSESGNYTRSGYAHPSMLNEALWQNLALVAHQLGRKDIAARNYDRLLRFDPQNAVARQNLPLLLSTRPGNIA